MARWLASLLALFGIGCAPAFVDRTVNGVPNLVMVSPRLWRMGQPTNADSWAYLARTIGPRATVVKLNDEAEGVDAPPAGWSLVKAPIPPFDDQPWTVFVKPDARAVHGIVNAVVDAYRRGDTVVWHCSHGRDRTGLVSALVGMALLGWSRDQAWNDMIAHGFRWELPDLDAYWLTDVP